MRKMIFAAALVAGILTSTAAMAGPYCDGFAAGWRAAFENRGKIVGIPPICPIPPIGQDSYQGGYEAGLLRALSAMG